MAVHMYPFHARPLYEDKDSIKFKTGFKKTGAEDHQAIIQWMDAHYSEMTCDLYAVARLTEKSPGSGYSHWGLFK